MAKYRLKTLLKRDNSFRAVRRSDMKYLWAAYKKGAFDNLIKGMDQGEFTDAIEETLSSVSEVFILESVTIHGKIPIGIITTMVSSRTEPYVDWFPWASDRNKIEAAAYFLTKMRKRPMLIWATDDTLGFFTRLAQYGALRRIGKAVNFLDGEDTMIFQTRGN